VEGKLDYPKGLELAWYWKAFKGERRLKKGPPFYLDLGPGRFGTHVQIAFNFRRIFLTPGEVGTLGNPWVCGGL